MIYISRAIIPYTHFGSERFVCMHAGWRRAGSYSIEDITAYLTNEHISGQYIDQLNTFACCVVFNSFFHHLHFIGCRRLVRISVFIFICVSLGSHHHDKLHGVKSKTKRNTCKSTNDFELMRLPLYWFVWLMLLLSHFEIEKRWFVLV